jgi:hypothetical protein
MSVFAPTSSGRHTGKGINGQGIQPHGLEFIEFSKFIGLVEFVGFIGLIELIEFVGFIGLLEFIEFIGLIELKNQ